MKKCYGCGKLKDYNEFGKNRTKSDGYHNPCKACMKEYDKIYRKVYYQKNKERINKRKQFLRKRYPVKALYLRVEVLESELVEIKSLLNNKQ